MINKNTLIRIIVLELCNLTKFLEFMGTRTDNLFLNFQNL